MIPDLDLCGAVRGSAIRGAVVLLVATSRPISLAAASVFGWCAIFPGLLLSPLLFCPLALFTRASARSIFFGIFSWRVKRSRLLLWLRELSHPSKAIYVAICQYSAP